MRTEPNAFELCRVAKNFAESKCCYANTDCTDHTDFIYCPAEIAEIAEILFFWSHGNHGNHGNFLMDSLMVVDVFLKINFHHTSLTSMLDSS